LLQHVETIAGHVELFDGAVGTLEDSYFHDYEVSSPAIIHTLGLPDHVTLNLRRCHVAHYYEVLSQYGTNHIEDCLLEYQGYSGDGIDFDAGLPGSYIRRCTVRRGLLFNTDGLDMGEYGGTGEGSRGILIDSCLLHDFVDKGVSMGVGVDVTVTNTLIFNVDSGIAVKDNSVAGIYNCPELHPQSPTASSSAWFNPTTSCCQAQTRLPAQHAWSSTATTQLLIKCREDGPKPTRWRPG